MDNNSKFSLQESRLLIEDTLLKDSNALEHSVLKHFLLWGGFITVTAMIVGHLWQHFGGPVWNYLWFLSLPLCDVVEHIMFKKEEKLPVGYTTSVFKFSGKIFGVFCFIMAVATLLATYMLPAEHTCIIQSALISFLVIVFGYAVSISGYLMRNKFVISIGLFSGSVGAVVAMIVDGPYKMLVIAAVAFLTMVLPYFVRKK